MDQGPYLFDVGPIALGHAGTPVSESAMEYIKPAIAGEITAIVPLPAVVGAHHILRGCYYLKNKTASQLMKNFLDASRIYWYGEFSNDILVDSFDYSSNNNIEGWDGYFAKAAEETGANVVLTTDSRFERLDHVEQELILSKEEHEILDAFLEEIEEAHEMGDRFGE